MKKSPLSTPSGSRGKQSYSWKSHENSNRTGYSYVKSDSYQCYSPNGNQMNCGDDFIPLNASTPVPEQRRHSGNWYGNNRNHRNSGSGGFNHYRNNYYNNPKSNFNNSYSPYKHSAKQFGQKKNFQKGAHRQVDISRYIDMKSFLEDPWAELTRKLNDSKETPDKILSKSECLSTLRSVESDSQQDLETQFPIDISVEGCNLSQESKSSNDAPLSLNDNRSDLSQSGSMVDLKLENIKFSQDSKNEIFGSTNDSTCEDLQGDSDSGTDIGQKRI